MDLLLLKSPSPSTQPSAREQFTQLTQRIHHTRQNLISRYGDLPGLLSSPRLAQIEHELEQEQNDSRIQAFLQRSSSLRTRHKILRIALTLSAWNKTEIPAYSHYLEAHRMRPERTFELFENELHSPE